MLDGGAVLGIPMMKWNESTTDLLFFGKKRGGGREKRVIV